MEMDMEKVVCGNGDFVSWERVLGSLVEAAVAEALLDAAGKSVVCLLLAVGSLSNGMAALPQEAVKNSWDAIGLLRTESDVAPENKDDGETDEDDDDGEDEDVDEDLDADDDDLSGEEGSDDDDPDDPEANGGGGSDDDDEEEDEEEDEDAEDEEDDEEEDEEDDEESPQPPSKKRK